jgi:hypothetical protein
MSLRRPVIPIVAFGIIATTLLLTPNAYARHLSDTQRYNDGVQDGTQAASTDRQNGNQFNPACDPTGTHTSDGQHTTIYCSGWSVGYTSVWNGNNSGGQTTTQNQQQDQRQSQTVHTCIALKCEIIQRGSQGQDQESNQGSTEGGQ